MTKRKKRNFCLNCGNPCHIKYCSTKCQQAYQSKKYIENWLNGKNNGMKGHKYPRLSDNVRKYMLEQANYKCEKCGWDKINQYSEKSPLQIHHIDGDFFNNKRENLIVICPNCHSLTATYMALNMGSNHKVPQNPRRILD